MSSPSIWIPVFLLLLAGCSSSSTTDSASRKLGIVGTWRWVSQDGRQVAGHHCIRFFADGTVAWWPAIEARYSSNGVTYSQYRLDGKVLDSDPHPEPGTWAVHRYKRVRFRGDRMFVTGEESEEGVYVRVVPDLEPGQ